VQHCARYLLMRIKVDYWNQVEAIESVFQSSSQSQDPCITEEQRPQPPNAFMTDAQTSSPGQNSPSVQHALTLCAATTLLWRLMTDAAFFLVADRISCRLASAASCACSILAARSRALSWDEVWTSCRRSRGVLAPLLRRDSRMAWWKQEEPALS
jgi:hypothetical protein